MGRDGPGRGGRRRAALALTGVVFTLELTRAWCAGLRLPISSTTAYALSAPALKRPVLTESPGSAPQVVGAGRGR